MNPDLKTFQERHGARVRRSMAMHLLNIKCDETFRKIVDANPAMRHKLHGEGQTRYQTSVIWALLYQPAPPGVRSSGEETKPTKFNVSSHA